MTELDPEVARANLAAFRAVEQTTEFTELEQISELIYDTYDVPHSLRSVIECFGTPFLGRDPENSIRHLIADKVGGISVIASTATFSSVENARHIQVANREWSAGIPKGQRHRDRVVRLKKGNQLSFFIDDGVSYPMDSVTRDMDYAIYLRPGTSLENARTFVRVTSNLSGLLVAASERTRVY